MQRIGKITCCVLAFALSLLVSCDVPMAPLGGMPDRDMTYTVTFDKNGGDTGPSPAAKTVTTPETTIGVLPEQPSRDGYSFQGWNTAADGSGAAFTVDTVVNEDLTVYAQWLELPPVLFTVSFDGNGNSGGTAPGPLGQTSTGAVITLPPVGDLVLEGKYFGGWNTQADGAGNNHAAGASYTPTMDSTLYAAWTDIPPPRYTVSFRGNGNDDGSVPADIEQAGGGAAITLPPAGDLAKSGHVFGGWNPRADGAGDSYAAGASYTPTANITLYAAWQILYTVSFNSNGGSGVDSQVIPENNKAIRPTPDPTRNHQVFENWYSNEGLTTPWNFDDHLVTSNMTLYAKWLALRTVTFDAGGGTPEPPAQPVGQGRKAAAPPAVEKEHHTLGGWYRERGLVNEWDFDQDTVDLDITLYAKWELNRYTVTFNANGGTLSGGVDQVEQIVAHGGTVELPVNPSKNDYFFSGWYTQITDGGLFNTAAPVTGNISLFAHWSYGYASIDDIRAYLDNSPDGGSADNPVFLPVNINLGDMAQAGSGWRKLLGVIAAVDKHVKLDLSPCAMSGNVFNHIFNLSTGKDKIVSLVLPDAAAYIADMNNSMGYSDFTALKSIGGTNIASISGVLRSWTSLASVDFPNVTIIGSGAFNGCSSLASVKFPAATSIREFAFFGCTSLTSVDFPVDFPNVTSIENSAFSGCTGLTNVTLATATGIEDSVFSGCTAIKNITLTEVSDIGPIRNIFDFNGQAVSVSCPKVTRIEDSAFLNCTSLTSVNFPVVTSIGDNAFAGCTNLASVDFPKITSIGDNAFSGCTNLVSASFPATTSIGENAFIRCTTLGSFMVTGIGSLSAIEGNKALVRDGTELVIYPTASGSITLNNITNINDYAFFNCTGLTSVNFPTVMNIGLQAFSGCTNLTSVDIPQATSIMHQAFFGCVKLTSITLAMATGVEDYAFFGCTAIKSITLTEALDTGRISTIYDKSRSVLESVSCPKAMSISANAFDGCTSLTSVSFPVATSIGSSAFSSCYFLTNVDFPKATSIGSSAFSDCLLLTSVNTPKVENIGNQAFPTSLSTSLTITLGNPAPAVGTSIFAIYSTRTVTVRYPTGAEGYGTVPTDTTTNNWGNAFRGRGWDGTSYLTGTVNTNITLVYEPY